MSSIATAPSRTVERDEFYIKQPRLLANPDAAPAQDATQAEAPATGAANFDDVNRMERLLTQLEARSLALVPYGYGDLREARKPNSNLIAGFLVAIWLGTLVLGLAFIRYNNREPQIAERAGAPFVIPASDSQDQKVAASVDHLAKALLASSQRMNDLEAAMERSTRDLQRTKVNAERATAAAQVSKIETTDKAPTAEPADGTLPKNWHPVLEIQPTDAALPHKGSDGAIDYWIVPRGPDKQQAKVLPIGTTTEGVVVHNLEDGKDYTLTPAGEWRNGAMAPTRN